MHSDEGIARRILPNDEAVIVMARVATSYSPADTETLPGRVRVRGGGAVFEGNFGFFAFGDPGEGEEISAAWLSTDGQTWELIMLPPNTNGDGGHGAAGDIIFKSSDNHNDGDFAGPIVLWIGRFES